MAERDDVICDEMDRQAPQRQAYEPPAVEATASLETLAQQCADADVYCSLNPS